MHEVSCKALGPILATLKHEGRDPSVLLEDTGLTLARLRDKHERIDWQEYRRLMRNIQRIWTDDKLVDIGRRLFASPFFRYSALVAKLLFSPRDFYKWIAQPNSGGGNQTFSCIAPMIETTGPTSLRIYLRMKPGYEKSRAFLLITKGSFIEIPRVVGLPAANVRMDETQDGAVYDITYPVGGGLLRRFRQALFRPFVAGAAGLELREAYEVLEVRYQQLDAVREQLARQTMQLQTAHSISRVVHAGLDLDATFHAVAHALVGVAGFAYVEVKLDADSDGNAHEKSAVAGTPSSEEPLRVELQLRGKSRGSVLLVPRLQADRAERLELLEYVVPTITMAIDDALAFTAVVDYRANLELKVEQRTAELKKAHDELAATVTRLEEAQAARQRIFANINHEIRTPLSLVMLAAASIRRHAGDGLDEHSSQLLRDIDHNVARLLQLVDGMLLLAAGQEDKLRLRPAPCDAAFILRQIVSTWTPAAENSSLHIFYEGPQRCRVQVDEAGFERIVTNLVSNAIKFTPSGGSVEVALHEVDDDQIEVAVRDTGIGLDEEFKQRIFGRFEQGRPAVRAGSRGSGIGLSIVKQIAEAHGGHVRVENNRTGGTVFFVTLPREQDMEAIEAQGPGSHITPLQSVPQVAPTAEASVDGEVAQPDRTATATVLVAEDDPSLRAAIVSLLADTYRVVDAGDGLTALRLAKQHQPDLLISDVGMPGMDGIELTQRFREQVGSRLAPIILLTAYAGIEDRLAGLDAGAFDYVLKPFNPDELLARVRSQLTLRDTALRLHESQKLASLGLLSAGLAHELRNPANAVVNALEPLRNALPDELLVANTPVALLLEAIESGGQQISSLSRQLLGFTRPGKLAGKEESVSRLVKTALAMVERVTSDLEVEVRTDVGFGGIVYCSRPLIIQVLTNLLENAAHAAGAKGWIELRAHREGDVAVFEVSDSGAGVPVELRDKIFDPFFTTKPPGSGTGLGLTVSRLIVERHDGTLKVVDGPNGSVFRLELPTQKRLAEQPGASEPVEQQPSQRAS